MDISLPTAYDAHFAYIKTLYEYDSVIETACSLTSPMPVKGDT